MVFEKLAKKLAQERQSFTVKGVAYNPILVSNTTGEEKFKQHLTESALNLYEREKDIKKFTDLALSTPLDEEDTKYIDRLFNQRITDPFDEKLLKKLGHNKNLLRDLGL